MAITLVGSEWGVKTTSAVASVNLPAHTITVGNDILIAVVGARATAPQDVTPSDGNNTYTLVQGITQGAIRVEVWRATITTGGSTTITLTPSGGVGNSGMCGSAWEFNGLAASPLNDTAISNNASNTSLDTNTSATTAQGNELIFVAAGTRSGIQVYSAQTFIPSTTPTIGSTWLATGATCSMQAAWEIQGVSTGTAEYTATLGTSSAWGASLATFESAVAAVIEANPLRYAYGAN